MNDNTITTATAATNRRERFFSSKLAPQISMAIPLNRVWLTRQLCIRCYDNFWTSHWLFSTAHNGNLIFANRWIYLLPAYFHSFSCCMQNFNLHSYSWRHAAFVVGTIYPIILNTKSMKRFNGFQHSGRIRIENAELAASNVEVVVLIV